MQCNPVKGAVLDFDKMTLMENMTMRDLYLGKIQTDNEGKYVSDTIHPKQYGEGDFIRPSYIHVKVGIPDQSMYTTQLYFEGNPYLTNHEKQKPSLIMKVIKENSSKKANFDL